MSGLNYLVDRKTERNVVKRIVLLEKNLTIQIVENSDIQRMWYGHLIGCTFRVRNYTRCDFDILNNPIIKNSIIKDSYIVTDYTEVESYTILKKHTRKLK